MQIEQETGGNKVINKKYDFQTIGNKMLKEIDGKYIEEKYHIKPSKKFGQKLHQERIIWLKKNLGGTNEN